MSVTQIESVAKLGEYVGREVAVSDWLEVRQERISAFAEVTEDRQWIHVDTERAAEESPFKTTIAHGFLTLSLLPRLAKLVLAVGDVRMGINYGLNRVRFVSPVPAGCAHSWALHARSAGRDQWRRASDVERDSRARRQRETLLRGRMAGAVLRLNVRHYWKGGLIPPAA